jgi:hypothetical protein
MWWVTTPHHSCWPSELQILELVLSNNGVADGAQVEGGCNVRVVILRSDAV